MLELPQVSAALAARLSRVAPRASAKKWYEIKAAAGGAAEVMIYGEISWWEIDPDQFVRDLAAITASTLDVRINSAGGSVFGGVAIYNALLRHPARVVVHVDGVAASIASIIAMAGDEIRMGEGTFMMIHSPHWIAMGNAKDFRDAADLLDKVQGSMVGVYAARSGKTVEEVEALLSDGDHWLTAEEAVAEGFADAVDSGRPAVAARGDLSMYSNVPAGLRAAEDRETPKRIETKREYETFLREVGGFSHSDAKALAAPFRAAPRDEGGPSAVRGDQAAPRDEDAPNAEHADREAMERLQAAILNARIALAMR